MAIRDEIIRLLLKTEGADQVVALDKRIEQLGESGQEAARELTRLTDSLGKSQELQSAVDRYRQLARSYIDYSRAIKDGQADLSRMAAAQRTSAAALEGQRAELAEAREELARLNDSSQRYIGTEAERARAIELTKLKVDTLARSVKEAERAERENARALESGRTELERTAAAQERLLEPLSQLKSELESAGLSTTRLGAATKDLQAQADAARAGIHALAQSVDEQGRAAEAAEAAAARIDAAWQKLGRDSTVRTIDAQIEELRDAYATLANSGQVSADALARAHARMQEQIRGLVTGSQAWKSAGDAATDSARRISEAHALLGTRPIREIESEIQKLRDAYAALAASGELSSDELAQASRRATERIAELRTGVARTEKETSSLQRSTGRLSRSLEDVRSAANTLGSVLLRVTGVTAGLSAAIGAVGAGRIFGGAIDSARTFEAVLSEVRAVSGATEEQLQRMRAAAEQASSTTRFSAEQAATALGDLARASGDADTAIAQLPATLNLAQAAGLDASRSAEILTTALTQFGLAASDATRVADYFAREANSTQDSVEKLGLAMSYVAPLARQLGMSVEETTALLGAMAEEGFRGERAGTALRNVFSAMLDPASKFSRSLRTLGIDSKDFTGVIEGLARAGDEGRKAILSLDAEARPAISALVTDAGGKIRRLQEDFKQAAGEAARTAQAIGGNFEGASGRFVNALDFMRRALVEPILAPLSAELDEAAKSIRAFAGTADFKALSDSIRDFAVNASRAIAEFVKSIDFTDVAQRLQGLADSTNAFVDDVRTKADALLGVLTVIGNALSLFWNGVQTVVLGAATLAAQAVQKFTANLVLMGKAVAIATGTFPALQKVFEDLEIHVSALGAVTDEFARRTAKNAGEAVDAFSGLASSIGEAGSAASAAASQLRQPAQAIEQVGAAASGAAVELERYADTTAFATNATRDSEQAYINQQAALIAARESVQALKDQLLELVKSGKGSADEMQRLQTAIAAAEAEVKKLTPASKDAARAAEELKNAFADLRIVSQEELRRTADLAKSSFDTIVASYRSGQSAIEDVIRAFAAYADAERAATDVSSASEKARVESLLATKAASLGLTAELERAGAIGKKAGEETAQAMRGARDAIGEVTAAAGEMAAQQERVVEQVQQTNNQIIVQTQLTDAQRRAIAYLGQEWEAGRVSAIDYGRALQEIMSDGTEAIERQIAAAERARDALRELTGQLRDEADRASGNEAAIEDRRYQEQLARIKELEEAGGAAARREAQEARQLAEEEHRRRLAEIREQARARREAQLEREVEVERSPREEQQASATQNNWSPTININGLDIGNADERRRIARVIFEEIEQIGRRRGGVL